MDYPHKGSAGLAGPTVCNQCGAVSLEGLWQWVASIPKGAREGTCPACDRIRDNRPVGYLNLSGVFFDQHRDEIMSLAHQHGEEQAAQHPMQRIINVEHADDGSVTMTFTDARSPQRVAQAIMQAFQGKIEIKYPRATDVVHASWVR